MVMAGWLVGTFEPARVMVATAQTKSASASRKTTVPSQAAGIKDDTNGKGCSQLSVNPDSAAITQAIGGRIMTPAVSVGSAIAGLSCRAMYAQSRRMPGLRFCEDQ